MGHEPVFHESTQGRDVRLDAGYPWPALLFSPFWAFGKGLKLQGVVLVVLYGGCVVLTGVATHGIIVGAAIALWLGAFTAHNANDWLESSYAERGEVTTVGVEADSAEDARGAQRQPKPHRVLLENASPEQLTEMLNVDQTKMVV